MDEVTKTELLKKEIAQKIWDAPFLDWLDMLTKKELKVVVETMYFSGFSPDVFDEMDWKDTLFEHKCCLIELLDRQFFDEPNKL